MVGKPNRIEIPLRFKVKRSVFNNSDAIGPRIIEDRVNVLCYNDSYPRVLELDIDILTKNGRFRMGELANTLPPGIELDRKRHPNLNTSIAKMTELEENKIFDWSLLFDPKKMREDMNISVTMEEKMRTDTSGPDEETEIFNVPGYDPLNPSANLESLNVPQRQKKEYVRRRQLTMKEIIKQEGMEINPELAEMDVKKKR